MCEVLPSGSPGSEASPCALSYPAVWMRRFAWRRSWHSPPLLAASLRQQRPFLSSDGNALLWRKAHISVLFPLCSQGGSRRRSGQGRHC